jgi:polyribonucleotide nucleotidyltransferase
MDAGVPISKHVAAVSIGLFTDMDEDNNVQNYRLVTDIVGLEDHLGDMDYKVAGTRDGVTAIQLDMKLPGIPLDILIEGLDRAEEARCKVRC